MRPFLLAAAAVSLAMPAAAQDNCAARTQFTDRLEAVYSETQRVVGIMLNGTILEIFASPDGGTWTLLQTRADGLSCIIAAGEGIAFIPAIAEGDPA